MGHLSVSKVHIENGKVNFTDEEYHEAPVDSSITDVVNNYPNAGGKIKIEGDSITDETDWGPLEGIELSEKITKKEAVKSDEVSKEKSEDKTKSDNGTKKTNSSSQFIAYDKDGNEVAPMTLSIGSDSDGSNYWSSDDAVSFYMPEYGLTYTLDPTWIGISNIVEQDKGLLVCPVLMTDGSPRGYKMLDSCRGFKIIPWTDEYIEQSDFFLLYSQKFAIEPRKRTDAYSQGESKEAMEQANIIRSNNKPEPNIALFSFDNPNVTLSAKPVGYEGSDSGEKDNS